MKPCKHAGCPKLTNVTYCDEHTKVHSKDRASAYERGYDSRWKKARIRFLQASPLCVSCKVQGKLVKATVVDHITPHRGNKELFWDEGNWQGLCKSCHDRKTMTEDRYQRYK